MPTPLETIKQAEQLVGSLGKTTKMNCLSYGLPVAQCPIGSVLMKLKGSVCSSCYALKGHYIFPGVLKCHAKRLASLKDGRWVEAMAFMITKRKCKWFRWHDSGDIQGIWHLKKIVEVALACPTTRFWLPTREKAVVKYCGVPIPKNLTIRLSAAMIDGKPPLDWPTTSTVVTGKATCPAPKQNNNCGDCRRCWNPRVKNVSYHVH